ncbi:MAG: hypothetical protein RLN70_07785 [Rhodospirillaceae bacterium]
MSAATTSALHSTLPQWFAVREFLLPALDLAATHSEADVLIGILEGSYQLWAGRRAAIVTEIKIYPKFKSIHFWLVGGEMKEVLDMEEPIIKWSRDLGCTRASAAGRKGWQRVLEHWSFDSITMTRKI